MKPLPLCRAVRMAAALALVGWAGASPAAADDEAVRARLRTEREAAETLYLQELRECSTKFFVTSCVDAARARRYATLGELDRQQEVLDEARRTQRATERQRAIDDKVSGEEARQREEAARERAANRPAAELPAPLAGAASAASSAQGPASRTGKATVDPATRAEQEARARRAFEIKQMQAEAHRQQVERRNQERARKADAAAPLPVPAASAVPSAPESRAP